VRLEWPWALLVLLLVPIGVLARRSIERRRSLAVVQFTNIDVLAAIPRPDPRRRAYLPAGLMGLALACAFVAIARPAHQVTVSNERTSIVLAVDMSGSMAAVDVRPTRLAAAEQAVRRFLADVPPRYRVGLVTFSSTPQVVAPLVWDRRVVRDALADAGTPGQGTAIGDALARSIELLEPIARDAADNDRVLASAPSASVAGAPSAVILLSDGAQTGGRLSPLAAADRAAADGIPVYTIALGTSAGLIHAGVFPLRVPPDPAVLQMISRATGGTFFAAMDEADLDVAYEHLASTLGRTRERRDLGFAFAGLAGCLALLSLGLSLCWRERLP
jgi:Ca-activated chloride channel family protein